MSETIVLLFAGSAGSGKDSTADAVRTCLQARGYHCEDMWFAAKFKHFAQKVFDFTHDQVWGPSSMRAARDQRFHFSNARSDVMLRVKAFGPSFLRELFRSVGYRETAEMDQRVLAAHLKLEEIVATCLLDPQFSPRRPLQLIGTELGRDMVHTDVWPLNVLDQVKTIYSKDEHEKIAFLVRDCRFENEPTPLRRWVREHGTSFGIVKVERPGAGLQGEAAAHVSEDQSWIMAMADSWATEKSVYRYQNETKTLADLGYDVERRIDMILAQFAGE